MITGSTYSFDMTFSNIDSMSPDGMRGPATLKIELRWSP
jgi:hypothetical protein